MLHTVSLSMGHLTCMDDISAFLVLVFSQGENWRGHLYLAINLAQSIKASLKEQQCFDNIVDDNVLFIFFYK